MKEGNDFTLGTLTNGVASSITLNSGASASDTITIYTFTGSVLGDGGGAGSSTGQFTETMQTQFTISTLMVLFLMEIVPHEQQS